MRLRNYFLTGIVVAAPIGITIYLTWTFVHWVDSRVKPLIPRVYNPDNYLPFSVPGVGLLFAILILTLLGFLTANLVGRTDRLLRREAARPRAARAQPLSRAAAALPDGAVADQPLVPEGRAGRVSDAPGSGASASSRPARRARSTDRMADKDLMAVFVPNTPNVTAGFLVFVPRKDVIILDMSVEEAAKMIISAGLVTPEEVRAAKAAQRAKPVPEAAE